MAPIKRPLPAQKRRHPGAKERIIRVHPPPPLNLRDDAVPEPGRAHPYTQFSARPAVVRRVLSYSNIPETTPTTPTSPTTPTTPTTIPWANNNPPYSPASPRFAPFPPPSPLRAWLSRDSRGTTPEPAPPPKREMVVAVAAPPPPPRTITPGLIRLPGAAQSHLPFCANPAFIERAPTSWLITRPGSETPARAGASQTRPAPPAIPTPALTPPVTTITPVFNPSAGPATPATPATPAPPRPLVRLPITPSRRKRRPPPIDIGVRLAAAGVVVEGSDTEMEEGEGDGEGESDDEEHELRTLYAYMNPGTYGRVDLAHPLCSPIDSIFGRPAFRWE